MLPGCTSGASLAARRDSGPSGPCMRFPPPIRAPPTTIISFPDAVRPSVSLTPLPTAAAKGNAVRRSVAPADPCCFLRLEDQCFCRIRLHRAQSTQAREPCNFFFHSLATRSRWIHPSTAIKAPHERKEQGKHIRLNYTTKKADTEKGRGIATRELQLLGVHQSTTHMHHQYWVRRTSAS